MEIYCVSATIKLQREANGDLAIGVGLHEDHKSDAVCAFLLISPEEALALADQIEQAARRAEFKNAEAAR